MKRWLFRVAVAACLLCGPCCVYTASGQGWISLALSAIKGVADKVGLSISDVKEIEALIGILEQSIKSASGTDSLTGKFGDFMRVYHKYEQKLDDKSKKVNDYFRESKYLVYATEEIMYFHDSFRDYCDYVTERGFDSYDNAIRTTTKGLRYMNSAVRYYKDITELVSGKYGDDSMDPIVKHRELVEKLKSIRSLRQQFNEEAGESLEGLGADLASTTASKNVKRLNNPDDKVSDFSLSASDRAGINSGRVKVDVQGMLEGRGI